ncbi:hypothetical protein FIBSPDRAFT_964472 [Athelia psychrophila]|uniref:Uncharacterized protein n=1 Tax=Athelia psychrophila TaxID=1759441 RepID=A0A165XS32_9AGAM|nr:hypothetical protein FIBSPDRAFT_964472 [Fibularhizoctonia sp. CBS 109695]
MSHQANASIATSSSRSQTPTPHPQMSSLLGFPSMAHSLASLPSKSGLPREMLHHNIGRNGVKKGLSEAKLDSALRKPKHSDAPASNDLHHHSHNRSMDDSDAITFAPKRNYAPKTR